MTKMLCYRCGKEYEAPPGRLKAWAESGHDFEPTDWECPECAELWFDPEWLDVEDDDDLGTCLVCGESVTVDDYFCLCDGGPTLHVFGDGGLEGAGDE